MDDRGNIISESTNGKNISYKYDELNQLINYTKDGKTSTYEYDLRQNLIKETTPDDQIIYTYNIDNELLTKKSKKEIISYKYDKNGRLLEETSTSGTKSTYEYDEIGNLSKGENEKVETKQYDYNALGARVKRTQTLINKNLAYQNSENGQPSEYLDNLEEEISENGLSNLEYKGYRTTYSLDRQREIETKEVSYISDYTKKNLQDLVSYETDGYSIEYSYGNGLLSQTTKAEKGTNNIYSSLSEKLGTLYFHQTKLGGNSYTRDEQGDIIHLSSYDVWGNIESEGTGIKQTGLDESEDYTGHNYDKVIEKYFVQFRFYDSEAKRFTSKDTNEYFNIFDISTHNKYDYVGNNPVNLVDYNWHEGEAPIEKQSDNYETRETFGSATDLKQNAINALNMALFFGGIDIAFTGIGLLFATTGLGILTVLVILSSVWLIMDAVANIVVAYENLVAANNGDFSNSTQNKLESLVGKKAHDLISVTARVIEIFDFGYNIFRLGQAITKATRLKSFKNIANVTENVTDAGKLGDAVSDAAEGAASGSA